MTGAIAPPEPSARLAYRLWRHGDAARLVDMYRRPEVYRFLGTSPAPVTGEAEAVERIDRWRARTDGARGIWAITRREAPDGEPLGTVLLVPLPRSDGLPDDAVEIGWHLHPDAWGRGYATEAGRAMIDRGRQAGIAPLRAVVHPDNAASHSVCLRLGMAEQGPTDHWYGVRLVEYVLDA